ncbi:MAG: phage integrase SAM-like domain-containing protein [Bacteroidales bacterium]|nr:phage integrase SAM-like domain-containing protein [Bacteroidales bacterium]
MGLSFLKIFTKRQKQDGTFPIKICVGFGKDIYLSTGLSCKLEHWEQEAQLYTGPNSRMINSMLKVRLHQVMAKMQWMYEDGLLNKLTNKEIRARLEEKEVLPKPKLGENLKTLFKKVIAAKSKGTAVIYQSTLKRLEQFCDPSTLTFDDINRLWLDNWVNAMSDLSPTTQSIHLRNLRTVNNYALDCEATTRYAMRNYRLPKTTTRKRSFDIETIRKIATSKLPQRLEHARDIFMLVFYLIGINIIDLCHLTTIKDCNAPAK